MKQAKSLNQSHWLEFVVTEADTGKNVQEILTGPMGISRRMIQKLTRRKAIIINKKSAFLKRTVKTGDIIKVQIRFSEQESLTAEVMSLNIVFEDDDLLILNKPPGTAVHPTENDQSGTLANGVAYHFAQQNLATKVRPVHRLDQNTSGVIAFAKNQYAHQHLDSQLRNRELKREYLAVVEGQLQEDKYTIDLPIGRHPSHPTKRMVSPKGEPAVTHLEVMQRFAKATLVKLSLETGRTHQIRVHLSHLGHPLWGDRLYGSKSASLIKRQALHALRLTLAHPRSREALIFEAPLPEDIEKLISSLSEVFVPQPLLLPHH
ncbi:MAG: RluA family pseudouridine synthase [Carboxydocellales bacterium]